MKTSNSPFEILNQIPTPPKGEKQFAGWKAKIVFNSPDFAATLDIRHGKADVEPIMELEGEMVKVDPQGNKVVGHETTRYFRLLPDGKEGDEVPAKEVRKMQRMEDGSLEPAADLPKTTTISILEGREKTDCVLDPNNPAQVLGTTIPREEVDRYAPESTYEYWDYATGLLSLAQYLEREKLALYYPFSHGRGTKIYTGVAFPIRLEEKLYLVTRLCSGQIVYTHPIQKPAEAASETTQQPIVVMPRFKKRQQSLG